jgi:ubiquitin-protein ligase
MTYREFIENGLIEAFTDCIQTRQNANLILDNIEFPRAARPTFPREGMRNTYWQQIAQQIQNGILPRGTDLQILVDAGARIYPTNPVFRQIRTMPAAEAAVGPAPGSPAAKSGAARPSPSGPSPAGPRYTDLMIQGWDDEGTLIDEARARASAMGMPPESVESSYHSIEGTLLQLDGWTPTQGQQLAQALSEAHRGAQPLRASVAASNFEDYLLRRLYVEGPDQRQFEILDIPASTKVHEFGQGVMHGEYSDGESSENRPAGPRRGVVVDRVSADGTSQRLDPDKTLHEQTVQEDDRFSISHETTAGSVNPVVRESALVRVREEMLEFAEGHPDFSVGANSPIAPTEYVFRFKAPSFGSPRIPGGDPVEIEDHAVYVFLPADFPMTAPQAYWQAPIVFHPNVHPKNGAVCLGELADRYLPGLSFGRLCQLLIDIASYRNYAVQEGYNLDAQKWAISERGMAAIERRGGQSFLRIYFQGTREPRRLWIRPVEAREDLGREERHEQRELSH